MELLDTNIIVAFLKGNPAVVEKVGEYLDEHEILTISVISYYEVLRGLKALGSKNKLQAYYSFISDNCKVEELKVSVMEKASDVYVQLKSQGKLVEDADILVAAMALSNGLAVVTDNERHFKRIEGLEVENWLRE